MGSADMFGELVSADTIKSVLGNAHGMLVRPEDLVAGSGDFSREPSASRACVRH